MESAAKCTENQGRFTFPLWGQMYSWLEFIYSLTTEILYNIINDKAEVI